MRGHEKRRWEKLKKGQNERKKRWRCNVQVDKMMLAQHQAGDLSKVYPTSDPMEAGPGFSIWIMRSLLLFSLFAFFLICCFSVLCSSRRRWTLPRVLSPFTFCQDTPNKLCRKGLSLAFFFRFLYLQKYLTDNGTCRSTKLKVVTGKQRSSVIMLSSDSLGSDFWQPLTFLVQPEHEQTGLFEDRKGNYTSVTCPACCSL